MKYINWAANVNQKVLDSTDFEIGASGYSESKSESGNFSERSLTSIIGIDTYNVVMDFDWLVKDENGDSEFTRFVKWYKYNHKRGINPFWFPSISDFSQTQSMKNCLYKITSSLKPKKSGYSYRVSMTWEEVYSGIIDVNLSELEIDHIIIESDGRIEIVYTGDIQTEQTLTSHYLEYRTGNSSEWKKVVFTDLFQEDSSLFYYFDKVCTDTSSIYYFRLDGSPLENMNCKFKVK